MKIIGQDKYPLTSEEMQLLEEVNEFELKIDDKHVIRFKDLLDRVIVCLDGKRDRIKKLPFSEPELSEVNIQLEDYIDRGDTAYEEKDKEKFDALLIDLKKGIRIKREEQIVIPVFNHSDGGEHIKEWESWKSRLQNLKESINGGNPSDANYPEGVSLKDLFNLSEMEVTKIFPLSEPELSEAKIQLEDYIDRGDTAYEEKDNEKFNALLIDLKKGIRIKREKQIVIPVFCPSDGGEHIEKWESCKSRLQTLGASIDRAKLFDVDYFERIPLKGLFTPSEMEVTLFLENMDKDGHGKRKKEDVVYVFIHEMLHAYYYCCFDKPGNSVREIEECLAEFGALCFLEQLSKTKGEFQATFKEVFEHAKGQIEAKRFTIGDLAAYGFGKYVFDHCPDKNAWILAYSKKSLLLDVDMRDVAEYVKRVYPFYPVNEFECYKCLEHVLFDDNRPQYVFEHFNDFPDVALRILLVDDKVGGNAEKCHCKDPEYKEVTHIQKLKVERCENMDCAKLNCKLCTIKRLMDDSENEDGKNILFKGLGSTSEYYYWKESGIECYYCPTVTKDFIDSDNVLLSQYKEISVKDSRKKDQKCFKLCRSVSNTTLEIPCDFEPLIDLEDKNKIRDHIDKVQIVGVRDVRTALLLLSRYKFDMLFIDYLLDKKDDGGAESGREYSVQFFEFLSTDYDKKAFEEKDPERRSKLQLLAKLRRAVLDNRGPLNKLWIMPITGFNDPFIQALQNRNVPLISTRWHIENGADPITTPWQFLVKLNQFIELQLKGCVYVKEQLIGFITYSGTNLEKLFPRKKASRFRCRDKKPNCRFHDFQAFMGAEFSNFISRFGARPVIRRDAMREDEDTTVKSVFSTYVWNNFYTGNNSNESEKRSLFALHNLMQIFYQVAATMPEDRNGVMRLRESFRRLRYYLEKNNFYIVNEKNEVDPDKKKALDDSFAYIADCIDVLLEKKEKEKKNTRK